MKTNLWAGPATHKNDGYDGQTLVFVEVRPRAVGKQLARYRSWV